MGNSNVISKWQRELISFKGIKSTFIIEGNINDQYFMENPENGEVSFDNLNETLNQIFNPAESEEYDLVFCDPLFGFSDPLGKNAVSDIAKRYQDIAKEQRDETQAFGSGASVGNIAQISEIIRAAITMKDTVSDAKPVAVVLNFASRLVSSPDRLSDAETAMFLNLFYASRHAIRVGANIKTLLLVVDKFNDIPAWFYLNNPNVRTVSIPNPDRVVREAFVSSVFNDLNSDDPAIIRVKNRFIDMTEGMKLIELNELRRLYQKSQVPALEITDMVSIYKFGFKENKWEAMREKIENDAKAESCDTEKYVESKIRKRVKGQEVATKSIAQIIKRSITGLSGMQHSSSGNKPRGIMFLAGPTGTGKTEIVKTVAELLFGDEKTLIRFDMSEYTAEHADQKLFGAPPGYTGYDKGGQLTNAVKTNPFSVILFDEIEKAHTSIMDKFLQILEDGRMTDGQGNTVYFSETLIFFTSNAGISEEICDEHGRVIARKMIVQPDSSYDEIQEKVESALKTKFKPEVLNRIGKNIIVFNYITEAATGEILHTQLDNIVQGIARKSKIQIAIDDSAIQHLVKLCLEKDTRENGGRGIGNVVESEFLNPLAEHIFDSNAKSESVILVSSANEKIVFERRG